MITYPEKFKRVNIVHCLLVLQCSALILIFPGCNSSGTKEQPAPEVSKEDLIRNQQHIIKDESEDIEAYAGRRNLTLEKTGTGLRYKIYHEGSGLRKAVKDDYVKMNYSVSLLDGTVVYSSDSTGAMEFQVGKSEIAGGLQEGIILMKEGDKAVFIIPSHLAYGLTGDGDKIKHYETLVIDVELLGIKPGKQ